MAADWFYLDANNQQVGPISSGELKDLFLREVVSAKSSVKKLEMNEWVPFSSIKEELMDSQSELSLSPKKPKPSSPLYQIPTKLKIGVVIAVFVSLLVVLFTILKGGSVEDFTHIPIDEAFSHLSNCNGPNCEEEDNGTKWIIGKGAHKKNVGLAFPRNKNLYRLRNDSIVVILQAGGKGVYQRNTSVYGDTWYVGIPEGGSYAFLQSQGASVPCVDMAKCYVSGVYYNEQLISSTYSICYEPTATDIGAKSVSQKVIFEALKHQRKRLPELDKNATQVKRHQQGPGVRYLALSEVSYDDEELFGASGHSLMGRGIVRGCVNAFWVKNVPGITEELFTLYEKEKAKESEVDDALKRLTVPQ